MKAVVLIKQVPEAPSISGEPGGEGTVGTDSENVTNPFDRFAVEEALQGREKNGGEVQVVALGPDTAVESLREALAMGVNGATHLKDPAFDDLDASGVSMALAKAVEKIGDVDLVFVGKTTIDTNNAVTGPMVARHLGMSLVTDVFKVVETDLEGRTITVERLMEGGLQKLKAKLPALVAVTKDINEPRYASLLGIRKAAKAPIIEWSAADLGVEATAKTRVAGRQLPPARAEGETFQGEPDELVDQLVEKLAQAKFI